MLVGLGDMDKIKYHDISDQIPRYRCCNSIVGMVMLMLSLNINYYNVDIMTKWVKGE